nr:BTB/POZ domain-containing protein 7 isoform X2 [Helicoverpa armigera]
MSRLLCCLCARPADMGAALSHPQEGEACEAAGVAAAPPTMADVIRERKKKAAGSGLGTLRRRIALVRRPRDNRPDRGCEHARFIRAVVSSWRLAEVFLLCEELEAAAALRDLVTQAELAREPAGALHQDLARAHADRWWCDVELVGAGWSIPAHRAILSARCTYFRDLLQRYPPSCCRVPLEGACSALSREELEAVVLALYAGNIACSRNTLCHLCAKWDRGVNADGDLDIINVDNNATCRSCSCNRSRMDASTLRRLGALLGFTADALHRDMRYLLESAEAADARLVFRLDAGCGAAYGFRAAADLPCHRIVLAARSRFFRSVMSRRAGGAGGGAAAWCVDEKVLPRRFARALLHAAYTDTVDLSLIGRNSTSPSSTNSTGSGNAWSGVARGGSRPVTAAMLDDAFQLYEIARFVEMPIVVQGCEDAIVEALTPDSLPHVLRWAAQPHASHWVHRQAMRYLRDEFPTIMSGSSCGRIPTSALCEALASPFLQASEPQALRALLRWAAAARPDPPPRESGLVWARAQSVGRRGGRRRDAGDAALRDALAPLAPLLRLEHLPPDHELLQQVVRRGIVAMGAGEGAGTAAAWLGRGSYRPPRCFLPYLDELKALLEDQAVPEAELSRARRERYLHRIPDTLYMVAAARTCPPRSAPAADTGGARACVSPRVLAALRARTRLLRAAPPAARALALHEGGRDTVYKQIALRAVREMSLPDACADLLLADLDLDREREAEDWESATERERQPDDTEPERWPDQPLDCCRTLSGSGSLRCASGGSVRAQPALHIPIDNSRAGTCGRREGASRSADAALHRQSVPRAAGRPAGAALSACVPDVCAPNANTHLLTARDYFRHAPPWEYSGGGVLQLDLGDGATHTPRPGSRAQRAGGAHGSRQQREHTPVLQAMSCLRSRADDDELRAAIELSVIRAYSSSRAGAPPLAVSASPPLAAAAPRAPAPAARGSATLPHERRAHAAVAGLHAPLHQPSGSRSRASASPQRELHAPAHHLALSRLGSERSAGPSRSPSPHSPHSRLYRPHYRVEPSYSGASASSRHTYA